MRDRDPQRYYAALNVSPTASFEEIKLSYEFLKRAHQTGQRVAHIGRIQAAYDTLANLQARARYDKGEVESTNAPTRAEMLAAVKSMLGSTVTLGVAVAVLVGLVALTFAPTWVAATRSFSPGDDLVWEETGEPIGRVVAFESDHEFSGGIRAAGYRIQPERGDPVWMPAGDLKRHSKRRR